MRWQNTQFASVYASDRRPTVWPSKLLSLSLGECPAPSGEERPGVTPAQRRRSDDPLRRGFAALILASRRAGPLHPSEAMVSPSV